MSDAAAWGLASHFNGLKHHQACRVDDPRFEVRLHEPSDIVPVHP